MTKVKICGLTNLEDTLKAIELGADAIGFNFYPDSPRFVMPEVVEKILEEVPESVVKVGVFVNEGDATVREVTQELSLDFLQFHGDETPYYCEQFATPYWKVFRLKDEKSLNLMEHYDCEYYLIDTYDPNLLGGTGKVGRWDLAKQAKTVGKIFLAGGLNPDNIEEAIAQVHPEGVDVASGVESDPGKKDHKKMEDFLLKVKNL
jgi:phosphoribosylanthranilate isomerase